MLKRTRPKVNSHPGQRQWSYRRKPAREGLSAGSGAMEARIVPLAPVVVEPYTEYPRLGLFCVRCKGRIVAFGVVKSVKYAPVAGAEGEDEQMQEEGVRMFVSVCVHRAVLQQRTRAHLHAHLHTHACARSGDWSR